MESKKNYLTIRQIAELLGDAKFNTRVRRPVIEAFRSGRFGKDIINTGRGVNLCLLVEESIIFDVLDRR